MGQEKSNYWKMHSRYRAVPGILICYSLSKARPYVRWWAVYGPDRKVGHASKTALGYLGSSMYTELPENCDDAILGVY